MELTREAREHLLAVTRPALLLAPRNFIGEISERLRRDGVQEAVAAHSTPAIFNWMIPRIALQGIGDRAALAYAERTGTATWEMVADAHADRPRCPRLRSYWHFAGCGFRKEAWRCAEPDHIEACPVPQLPARKGGLAVAAVSLRLFLRDCCDDDVVGWIDRRLAAADPGISATGRAAALRKAVLTPLCEVAGVGAKIWSMVLADLLLAGDPGRERWVSTGAAMIAVDSLVHNHLHRTGSLRGAAIEHPYGPNCYDPDGCADLIEALAGMIDAREFDPAAPARCPRFVQHALWHFCAEGGLRICNGRQIDDQAPCDQRFCPARSGCDRIPINEHQLRLASLRGPSGVAAHSTN